MSQLLETDIQQELQSAAGLKRLGDLETILANSAEPIHDPAIPHLIAPVDLQSVKACGVTFADSLIERVIEERAGGDRAKAEQIRESLRTALGSRLLKVKPGSKQAEKLKELLISEGLWSQYLEVGIGPYAEVFTKCQPLSAVGQGAEVGIYHKSEWNNPEPEAVLMVNSRAEIVGACLGNDVNLRDIEGRSALLLGKAKDNNASCSIGPFIRLLDNTFSLNDLRQQVIELRISGSDGFELHELCSLEKISRDVTELVAQTINESHQYPDGLALFTGSLFAPTQDRGAHGKGFTHRLGDLVQIRSKELGCLSNRVTFSKKAPPWRFGLAALLNNLAQRGLLDEPVE